MSYKNKICGIYKIVNSINGKLYIGSALNIMTRFATHKHLLFEGKHFNLHLHNAWDKYGSDNFLFEILEECDKECLKDKEEYYIQTLKSNDRELGYNIRINCSTNLGLKSSNETREKLRISHLGQKRSKETQEKISKAQSKAVIQLDVDFNILNTFESLKQAAEVTNCSSKAISLCTTGKMKTHPRNQYYWCLESNFSSVENFKNYILQWKKK